MNLIDLLAAEAARRELLAEGSSLDAATAFQLVRDMPYIRASSREPETIIREWRGTCSGKHYLLQALFAELGLTARLIACTSARQFSPESLDPALYALLAPANGRFVDVHNYLILELPDGGEMIVDATWPLAVKGSGLVVNEHFSWARIRPSLLNRSKIGSCLPTKMPRHSKIACWPLTSPRKSWPREKPFYKR